MQSIAGEVKYDNYDTSRNTVPAKKFESAFFQKGDKSFNGQHSYYKSDNTADKQKFNILVKIGGIEIAVLLEIP